MFLVWDLRFVLLFTWSWCTTCTKDYELFILIYYPQINEVPKSNPMDVHWLTGNLITVQWIGSIISKISSGLSSGFPHKEVMKRGNQYDWVLVLLSLDSPDNIYTFNFRNCFSCIKLMPFSYFISEMCVHSLQFSLALFCLNWTPCKDRCFKCSLF